MNDLKASLTAAIAQHPELNTSNTPEAFLGEMVFKMLTEFHATCNKREQHLRTYRNSSLTQSKGPASMEWRDG